MPLIYHMNWNFNANLFGIATLCPQQTQNRGKTSELKLAKVTPFRTFVCRNDNRKVDSSVKGKKAPVPVPLRDWNSDWKMNPGDLPTHGLIKLKLRHRFRCFRFIEIGLINTRLASPVVRGQARFEAVWLVHRYRFNSIERPLMAGIIGVGVRLIFSPV